MSNERERNRIGHSESAEIKKGISKSTAEKKYLSKRILLSAASRSLKAVAAETMKVQGYTFIAEHGWVIKVNADGTKERVKRIEPVQRPAQIRLK